MNKNNDPGKVVVHIGPPKTGTTSLQYYFQEFTHPDFFYLGVHQPRKELKNDLYSDIYNYCCNAKPANTTKLNRIHKDLKIMLKTYQIVFISEEILQGDSRPANGRRNHSWTDTRHGADFETSI